jgi:hypothetical protein
MAIPLVDSYLSIDWLYLDDSMFRQGVELLTKEGLRSLLDLINGANAACVGVVEALLSAGDNPMDSAEHAALGPRARARQ